MTELEKSRMMMERRENILQSQTAKITCNYIEYHKMTDQMFYGVPLTETHLAKCTERLKIYLANGGAGNIMIKLGIGIELTTKQTLLLPEEIVSERFVWLKDREKGSYWKDMRSKLSECFFLVERCIKKRIITDGNSLIN